MNLIYMCVVSAQRFNHVELGEVRVITAVYETEQLDAVSRFLQISICGTASSGFMDFWAWMRWMASVLGLQNNPDTLCVAYALKDWLYLTPG